MIDRERFASYGSDYRACCYGVSYSRATELWLSRVVSWACGTVWIGTHCMYSETMPHGYAVNWGDSLTLYRYRLREHREHDCGEATRRRRISRPDNTAILSSSQFPRNGMRLPTGKQRTITADYYSWLRSHVIRLYVKRNNFLSLMLTWFKLLRCEINYPFHLKIKEQICLSKKKNF